MKNILIKTINWNTFDFTFDQSLELHKEIPALLNVYQVNGDLLCNILSQEARRGHFEPKLEVVFEDLYKNKYKFTIEQIFVKSPSKYASKYAYNATVSEYREWINVGESQFAI